MSEPVQIDPTHLGSDVYGGFFRVTSISSHSQRRDVPGRSFNPKTERSKEVCSILVGPVESYNDVWHCLPTTAMFQKTKK